MKYTVKSGSQFIEIGCTDSMIEAINIRDEYEKTHTTDDACIFDENGTEIDPDCELDAVSEEKYVIVTVEDGNCVIYNAEEAAFFCGYDFMGSVNWVKIPTKECCCSQEDAEQIVSDLKAADGPCDYPLVAQDEIDDRPLEEIPQKEYILKTWQGEIFQVSVETAQKLASIYEMDQECGIFNRMEVWDPESMTKTSLLDIVLPIIEQQHWIEEEYRNYSESDY